MKLFKRFSKTLVDISLSVLALNDSKIGILALDL